MACPDRNKDALILAEVARRKAARIEPIGEWYEEVVWTGEFPEFTQFYPIEQIEKIVQVSPNVWELTIRRKDNGTH